MKKWIRLPGVALFVVVVALFAAIWLLLADRLVKKGIEMAGSRAVGARVELADADLTLFPLGLELTNLQVTNPDDTMRNIVEVERIQLSIEPLFLLERKLVSDEMALTGVRLDTPRRVSGKLPDHPEKKKKKNKAAAEKKSRSFALPKMQVNSIDDILAHEKLLTVEAAEQLKADIQKEQENYRNLLKQLPDKKTFDGYRKRIKGMKGGSGLGGLLGAAGEAEILQKDVKKDIQRLKNAKGDLQGKIAVYRKRIQELKSLPQQDFQRLKKKYSLSAEGIGNVALLLLGPKYKDYFTKGLALYEKVRPYLSRSAAGTETAEPQAPERGQGVDVHFRETSPVPQYLIRKTRVSLLLTMGELQGDILDIASDQSITGKPITFRFLGRKLKDVGNIGIQGAFDHRDPKLARDHVQTSAKGYRLAGLTLSTDPDFPLALQEASTDFQVNVRIENQDLASKLSANVRSARFQAPKADNANVLQAAITDALAGISAFTVTAGMTGTLEQQEITVSSNLDQIMGSAVNQAVKKQAAAFERKLKQQISAKTGNLIGGTDTDLGGLQSFDKELTGRLNVGNGMLGNLNLF